MRVSTLVPVILVAAASVGRTQTPDHPPHVTAYDLTIVPDFAAGTLAVRAVVEIANPALADSLELGLSDRYRDVRVARADSSSVGVERGNGWITVRLGSPRPRDTLVFTLAGAPGRSLDEDREVIQPESLFLLWSDRFYPIAFGDWAVTRTTVVLPPGFQAVAPGRLVSSRRSGGAVRWLFVTSRPTRLVSVFADTRWIRTERRIRGIPMQTLLYSGSQRFAGRILATSADVLAFYRSLFGPYRFDGFTFVTLDSMYARRAFPGFVGYEPSYLAREFTTTGLDAHETALLWWFYTSAGRGPGSFQWTEGLGDYAEILYDEARGRPIPDIFARFRRDYLAQPTAQDVPLDSLRGDTPQEIVHGKYPWLMQVLRYVVGDRAFRRGVRLLFDRYRFRAFSADELVATLEEGTGQSLAWWRTEWLGRKGVPSLAARWSVAPGGPPYRVTGTVEQGDSVYHVPLEIAFRTSGGPVIRRVDLTGRQTPFATVVQARPTGLVLDPRHWLLARIADPEGPTPTVPTLPGDPVSNP